MPATGAGCHTLIHAPARLCLPGLSFLQHGRYTVWRQGWFNIFFVRTRQECHTALIHLHTNYYIYTINMCTMMRKTLFIAAFAGLGLSLSAQTIGWNKSNSANVRTDSIAKEILEPAQYLVTYTYRYVRDAANPDNKREGMTILQVGNRYNRFCDFYELRFDSLCDELSRGKMSVMEGSALMMAALKNRQFNEGIVIDRQENREIVQRTAGYTQKYEYEEDCPDPGWQLVEGDTLILGFHCNKATARLFGRDYIAWYSADVGLPYGPYKFNGLPGLVFHVTDTQGHFEFALDGLVKAEGNHPIYLWSRKDIVKTDRETVRKIYRNFCADPASVLTTDSSIKVSGDALASVKSKPYNPMELE